MRGGDGTGAINFCGLRLAHPIINASGTFDAIAARRAFGYELLERFPFSAFVTKTVTVEPRAGNPPPRLWELAGGLLNSIGLPNKGLKGFLENDNPFRPLFRVQRQVSKKNFVRWQIKDLLPPFRFPAAGMIHQGVPHGNRERRES